MDNNELLKFADDTKLYGVVTNRDEALSIQKDLNVLTQFTYAINGQVLQQVEAQSDIMIRNDLKASD